MIRRIPWFLLTLTALGPLAVPTVSAGESPYNPNANVKAPTYAFCWEVSPDYTVYITPTLILENVNVQSVSNDFAAFIRKTYGVNQSPQCPGARDQATSDATRQRQIDDLKRTTPKTRVLKFVDVDWKPIPQAADGSAPKPPSAPPPSSHPPDAYQKALEAQRPAGVAAALITFCYATGAPSGGGGPIHVYVTPVFASSPTTAQVGNAFQTFLRGAHPGENIAQATCSTAPDADTLDGTRQEYIAHQRQIPSRAVVEVDWKDRP